MFKAFHLTPQYIYLIVELLKLRALPDPNTVTRTTPKLFNSREVELIGHGQ